MSLCDRARRRRWAPRTIALALVPALTLGLPVTPAPAQELDAASDLEAICRSMASGANPYYGQGALVDLRRQLSTLRDPPERAATLGLIGKTEMVLGDLDAAIATLTKLVDDIRRVGLDERLEATSVWYLALAHLLLSEDENCVHSRSAKSCILPFATEALHSRPENSRRAGDLLLEYLSLRPEDVRAVWLLNLARRLSRDFPDGVPERLQLPEAALRSDESMTPWTDVAPLLGVDVVDLAGGAVADDFDGDGLIDLVSSTWDPCGSLKAFRNLGEAGFVDVTEKWGLDGQLGGLNLKHADYDGDGRLDLLVLRGAWMLHDGAVRNSLLRNVAVDGAPRFVDATVTSGLAEPALPTQAAAWADYDGDGDLDLYVANEAVEPGSALPAQLFRNAGRDPDGGARFVDVAAQEGVLNRRYAKAVAWGDYDDDGDPDLYVSNFGPNRLYRNDGPGREGAPRFVDVAPELGVTQPERESFSSWFFDYDNDGDLDLFVGDYRQQAAAVAASYFGSPSSEGRPLLYRNEGGRFEEVSASVGLQRPLMPMGANYGDLDNDGWLDVYLGTGEPELSSLMPNVMYRNASGRFVDVTFSGGFGHLQKGHGVAFADLDHDGDQDLFHQLGGFFPTDDYANALFLNPGVDAGWMTLLLEGTRSNRYALGARVAVRVLDGGVERQLHRVVGSGASFGSSTYRLEIGLAGAERVQEVVVRWPGGAEERFGDLEVNRFYRLVEGAGEADSLEMPAFRFAGLPERACSEGAC